MSFFVTTHTHTHTHRRLNFQLSNTCVERFTVSEVLFAWRSMAFCNQTSGEGRPHWASSLKKTVRGRAHSSKTHSQGSATSCSDEDTASWMGGDETNVLWSVCLDGLGWKYMRIVQMNTSNWCWLAYFAKLKLLERYVFIKTHGCCALFNVNINMWSATCCGNPCNKLRNLFRLPNYSYSTNYFGLPPWPWIIIGIFSSALLHSSLWMRARDVIFTWKI